MGSGACIICGTSFAHLPQHSTRKLCGSANCRREFNSKYKAERKTRDTGPTSVAQRTQGLFTIPDMQHALTKRFIGTFYCQQCGSPHNAPSDLRIQCPCGALWTFSLGEREGGRIAIVWLERWV